MANTVNVGLTTTTNTFNQWRITDNLMANDVNEIVRGNFTKPKGNVIISEGYLRLANSTGGVILDVTDDTNIDGTLTVFNIEMDNSSNHLYVDAGDIHIRRMGATDRMNVNTNTTFFGTNISITNVASGTLNVNNQFVSINTGIMNVSNTAATAQLNVHPNTRIFANANITGTVNVVNNVYTYNTLTVSNTSTGNLAVSQNTTTGNLVISQNTSTGNLVVSANANVGNANIVNAYIDYLSVGNPILAPAATNSNSYIIRYGLTNDADAFYRVQRSVASGNADLYWDDDINNRWEIRVNNALGPLALNNLTAGNISVTSNISTGNISVTQNGSFGNISVGAINATGNITGNVVATMRASKEYLVDTTVSGATTVDLRNSNWFKYTLTGNTTLTFSNAPASGNVFTVQLLLIQGSGGSKTVSWGNTIYWAGGQVPPATIAAAGNTDLWTLTTYDGGSTFIGTLTVKDAR
jgi:hypothetical protein